MIINFKIPRLIRFGCGAIQTLNDDVKTFGMSRIFILTDKFLKDTGLVDKVTALLDESGAAYMVCTDVEAEPSVDSIDKCAAAAKAFGADGVIGFGGGSSLDSAKAVAMLLGSDGDIRGYLGVDTVPRRGAPSILIPTNAGTSAEISANALFYIPEEREKRAVVSIHIVPDAAVIDPMLTLGVPPRATALTGIDALCHALESYTSNKANFMTEGYGLQAVRLVGKYLKRAYADGNDIEAREAMANASYYGGISMGNAGSHAVHALGYPLQGLFRMPHGLACSLMLPAVIKRVWMGAPEKFALAAEALGADVRGLGVEKTASRCAGACAGLLNAVGVTERLGDHGITEGDIDALTEGALRQGRVLSNSPKALCAEEIRDIFRDSL